MSEKKNFMPQSTAGLIRYFDTEKELIKIKPEHVIAIGVGFMMIVIFLRYVI